MKIFEVAGVGKLHGLTVMSLDSFVKNDEPEKEVEESTGKTVHRIGLTVTDPNHPMVSKRGETVQKTVRVPGEDPAKAINAAIAHYRRKGYKVHDHHYMGTVDQGVAEGSLEEVDRRGFLKGMGAAALGIPMLGIPSTVKAMGLSKEEENLLMFSLDIIWACNNASVTGIKVDNTHCEFIKKSLSAFWKKTGSDSSDLNQLYSTVNQRNYTESRKNDPVSKEYFTKITNEPFIRGVARALTSARPFESVEQGVAEGDSGAKYKVKSIGHDAKGDYYISPSTGKKVYKKGVKVGDHENPKTGEHKGVAEAPGDFGLGANYRSVPDDEMQALMGRSKNKEKTKRDKYDYPYIHGSNIEVKDEAGKTFDTEALKKSIMVRPASILGQNAKMQHSETGEEAIFDIGLPALKGLAVNEKTGEFVVVDTCPGAGECKTFCYAMKGSYVMFKAVSMGLARMLNFLLNDPEGFANKLNAEIAAAKAKMAKKNAKVVVRWHDAGDFFSPEYLDMAYGVATANPDVGFYAYTKMGDVATGARPKNFNMNFSGGALSSQEKKIDFKRVKHSKVVPKDMFFDLIARDGNNLKKDAKGRMQFASPANLEQFKSTMAQKYAIDRDSILTYDEMMKTPVGDTPKWNTIVMPGDGDNSANRNDVIGSYLLFH